MPITTDPMTNEASLILEYEETLEALRERPTDLLRLDAHMTALCNLTGGTCATASDVAALIDSPKRKTISAGLIRLMASIPEAFAELGFRVAAFKVLDVTSQWAYKHANIDAKSQTHEKESALVGTWSDLVDSFKSLYVSPELTADNVAMLRGEFLKVFNSQRSRELMQPLLPATLRTSNRYRDLFDAVESYCSSQASTRHEEDEEVVSICGETGQRNVASRLLSHAACVNATGSRGRSSKSR